ncbi:MAG TPA: acetylornithine deacetylase [Acidobacteriaceae bacterium]|jgi:acetylornithine deacetylase|nr:acetylornithine deacetylase [Acidobacteriaceae bacterium]
MKSVVDHLSDTIRIPSPSAISNRRLVDYAADSLRALGWSTRELPYRDPAGVEKVNLIAAPPGQNVEARDVDLVFMCHTDTVPFASDWDEALQPIFDVGMLHGCGACDVKGFLACLLSAAARRETFCDGLRIVLTAEEEIGCIGAARLLAENVLRPRRMVIGEPTSLHPARAGKGYCLAEVTVFGKEAHSAHPRQGVSAIVHAARLIRGIEDLSTALAQERHEFFDPAWTTINIGTIEGGTAKNIVPGICRFELEWRPVPAQSPDRVLSEVTQMIAQLHRVDPQFRAEVKPLRQQPGFATREDAPLVRRLESLSGRAAVSIPFGSEASIFAPVAEEIVVIGAGDMRTAHSSRECVPVAELEEMTRWVQTLMDPAF